MAIHNPLAGVPIRAARWSATHPWRAISGWLALVVVAVGLAATVSTEEASDADYRLGESGVADKWVHEARLDSPSSEEVLVTAEGGTLDPAQAEDAAVELARAVRPLPGVTEVSEAQWSPDRTALLISIQLAKDHEDAVREETPEVREAPEARQTVETSEADEEPAA